MSPVHWLDRPLSDDWTPTDPARYSMFRSWQECVAWCGVALVIGLVGSVFAFKAAAWLMVETWK